MVNNCVVHLAFKTAMISTRLAKYQDLWFKLFVAHSHAVIGFRKMHPVFHGQS